MWAVIENGGKQYKVSVGDVVEVEKIKGKKGSSIELGPVLLYSKDGKDAVVGSPNVDKVKVKAKILEEGKKDKVVILKHKPKKRYKVKRGHRQPFTRLEITGIENK